MSSALAQTPTRETALVVLRIPRERHVEVSNDEIRIAGVLVTRRRGWLALTTLDVRVPAVLRRINVHLAVDDHEGGSGVAILIDSIRFADIVWRDPNAF